LNSCRLRDSSIRSSCHSLIHSDTVNSYRPSRLQFLRAKHPRPSSTRANFHRPVATQKLTPADSHEILVAQRKLRPNSPHIAIYQPQIPWILSITHRITGSVLSGGFYIFGSAYLVAPLLGWHLDSVSLAAAFGAWPLLAKAGVKFALAWPFTFHCLNGLRHLMWDFALGFKNKFVIQSGWTVVGASLLSALGLAAFV
jgi:succinate dehydrogenase (ubiquinone) cytochrome b560 subunit